MGKELDSLLHTARLLATKQEQERIIKLLKEHLIPNEPVVIDIELLISLVKGKAE